MQLSIPFDFPVSKTAIADRVWRYCRYLTLSFRAHTIFFVIAGAYLIVSLLVDHFFPSSLNFNFVSLASTFVSVGLTLLILAICVCRFVYMATKVRPENPTMALLKDLRPILLCPRRMSNAIPIIIALFVFMQCYGSLKFLIPVIQPFSWDQAFMELDRWLHFGFHPWELLQPVLGYPYMTLAINFSYNLWFFIMWTLWVFLAFSKDHSIVRTQFFVSFMLCWSLGGSLLAVIFSSAGPCYYSLIGLSPDPFTPLMTYLRQTNEILPIWAIGTQDMLWEVYTGKPGLAGGISAMPSMHNATSVIFALVGWKLYRPAGIGLTIFAFLILVGSVHLGWHYAVDGYAAILLAVFFWWCSGKIAKWYHALPASQQYSEASAS